MALRTGKVFIGNVRGPKGQSYAVTDVDVKIDNQSDGAPTGKVIREGTPDNQHWTFEFENLKGKTGNIIGAKALFLTDHPEEPRVTIALDGKPGNQTMVFMFQGFQTIRDFNLSKAELDAKDVELDDKIDDLYDKLDNKIDTVTASVYTPRGSLEYENLPDPSIELEGDVYNILNEFTISEEDASKWVEGAKGPFTAGTNVVVVNDNGEYKWDILAGMIDLTPYAKTADFEVISVDEIDSLFDN